MNRILAVLDWLFPSVPPIDRVRLLDAMGDDTLDPGPGVRDDTYPGAGTTSRIVLAAWRKATR